MYEFDPTRPFGAQLREWRKTAGLSQRALSNALSEVQSRISLYEHNRAPFPLKRIEALLATFSFDEETASRIRAHVERTGRGARAQVDGLPDVGRALRMLRLEKDITLHEMASLLSTSYSRISHIERGIYRMQPSDLTRLREAFTDESDTLGVTRAYYESYVKSSGESFEAFLASLERVVLMSRLLEVTESMDVAALATLVRHMEGGVMPDGTG